jgi:predicted aldo/keto reductase-like oxidoreductase
MNDEAQVEENLRIAGDARPGSLTAAEIALIAEVARKYREIMKVACTGCGYCQPCPSGVDIPGCFDLFNAFHTFGKTQEAGFLYVLRAGGILSGRPAYASLCSRCLDCLEKGPQHLEIPDLLEQVAAQFEAEGLKERETMVRRFFAG